MDWNKEHLVWKENIGNVEIPMQIDKADMLKTIMSEGDFAFKSKNGFTLMNLEKYNAKTKKDIKLLEKVLWKQVVEFVENENKDKLSVSQ